MVARLLLLVATLCGCHLPHLVSSTCCFPARYSAQFTEFVQTDIHTSSHFIGYDNWYVDYEREEFVVTTDDKKQVATYRRKGTLYLAPLGRRPRCHKWIEQHSHKNKTPMTSMGMAVLFFQCPGPAHKFVNIFRNGSVELWHLSGLAEIGSNTVNQTTFVHLTKNTYGYTCTPYQHNTNWRRIDFERTYLPDGSQPITNIIRGTQYRMWHINNVTPMESLDGDLPQLKLMRDKLHYCLSKERRRINHYRRKQKAKSNARWAEKVRLVEEALRRKALAKAKAKLAKEKLAKMKDVGKGRKTIQRPKPTVVLTTRRPEVVTMSSTVKPLPTTKFLMISSKMQLKSTRPATQKLYQILKTTQPANPDLEEKKYFKEEAKMKAQKTLLSRLKNELKDRDQRLYSSQIEDDNVDEDMFDKRPLAADKDESEEQKQYWKGEPSMKNYADVEKDVLDEEKAEINAAISRVRNPKMVQKDGSY